MAKNNQSAVVTTKVTTENTTIETSAKQLMADANVDVIYGTADGNLWLPKDKNLAVDHAHKSKQELLTFNK